MDKKAIFKLFLEKINWFYSPQALNYNLNTPFSPLPTSHFPLPHSPFPTPTKQTLDISTKLPCRRTIRKNSAILSANSLENPISLIIFSGYLRKQIVYLFKYGFREIFSDCVRQFVVNKTKSRAKSRKSGKTKNCKKYTLLRRPTGDTNNLWILSQRLFRITQMMRLIWKTG